MMLPPLTEASDGRKKKIKMTTMVKSQREAGRGEIAVLPAEIFCICTNTF